MLLGKKHQVMTVGIDVEYGNLAFHKSFGNLMDNSDVVNAWNIFVNVNDMIDSSIANATFMKDLMSSGIIALYEQIKSDFIG